MIIAITKDNYIIRSPKMEFCANDAKPEGVLKDYYAGGIRAICEATLNDLLLIFTENGQCYQHRVKDIPSTDISAIGKSLHTLFASNDNFCSIVSLGCLFDGESIENHFILIMTANCKIVRHRLSDYKNQKNGTVRISLEPNDHVVSVVLAKDNHVVFNCANNGIGKMFDINSIPITALKSKNKGVICYVKRSSEEIACMDSNDNIESKWLAISSCGYVINTLGIDSIKAPRKSCGYVIIRLKDQDNFVFNTFTNNAVGILVVTSKGYAKMLNIHSLKEQHRGGVGIKCISLFENDKVVACCRVTA